MAPWDSTRLGVAVDPEGTAAMPSIEQEQMKAQV